MTSILKVCCHYRSRSPRAKLNLIFQDYFELDVSSQIPFTAAENEKTLVTQGYSPHPALRTHPEVTSLFPRGQQVSTGQRALQEKGQLWPQTDPALTSSVLLSQMHSSGLGNLIQVTNNLSYFSPDYLVLVKALLLYKGRDNMQKGGLTHAA